MAKMLGCTEHGFFHGGMDFTKPCPYCEIARLQSQLDDVKHLCRFLARTVTEQESCRMKILSSDDDARDALMMKWPMIQGMHVNMMLRKIAKQPYDAQATDVMEIFEEDDDG